MMNPLIPLLVAIPLAGAFLTIIAGRFIAGIPRYMALATTLLVAFISFRLLPGGEGDPSVYIIGGWEPVKGIPVGLYLVHDGFSALVLCIISLIGLFSVVYSFSYMARYTSENYFYALFCLMIAGMNGVVLSGDIFNIFVFLEISAISSYALVAFGVGRNELEATLKYQVLGAVASFLILFGIAFIYRSTGTLNIADIRSVFSGGQGTVHYLLIQILLLTGFGLKAAIIPFHAWLPDAHSSAPSPISAMLSGVLIKAVGIYVIIRLFFNMFVITNEMAVMITTLGALSMAVGVFLAIGQWDIKRLLAYHSISQMGYVIMSAGIGMILMARGIRTEVAALAITGGIFHMLNHAAFKSLLFLNAGAIEYSAGTRDLHQMGGLAGPMPVTSATSLAASLSISGVPPFNGFFSKLIIIVAAVMGHFYLLAALAAAVSIITLASFMKFQRYAFHNTPHEKIRKEIREVPAPMLVSMIALAVICLLLGMLALPAFRDSVLSPATGVLMDQMIYSSPITGI
jgi:multicomponent Na+:H+ antiporter subunit D